MNALWGLSGGDWIKSIDWVKTWQNHPTPQKNTRSQTTYCNVVLEAHFPSISSYSSTHILGSIFATSWVRPMFVLENILRGRCRRLRSSSIFCERKRTFDACALHKWGSCLRRFALSGRGSRTIVLQSRGEHAPFPNSGWYSMRDYVRKTSKPHCFCGLCL